MSVFSVPVTIGVDEERIAKEIENNVEQQVIDNIVNEIKSVMYQKNYCGRETNEPLKYMIECKINNFIEDHKQEIIDVASKELCEKMSRTKAYKEAIKKVTEEFKGE